VPTTTTTGNVVTVELTISLKLIVVLLLTPSVEDPSIMPDVLITQKEYVKDVLPYKINTLI